MKAGFSLKYKLLILLVFTTAMFLAFYLKLATSLFEEDKIAYIYDSTVSVSNTLAAQSRAEVNAIVMSLQPILEGYNRREKRFDSTSKDLFENREDVMNLVVFEEGEDGAFLQTGYLSKGKMDLPSSNLYQVLNGAQNARFSVLPSKSEDSQFFIGLRVDNKSGRSQVVVTQFESKDFLNAFRGKNGAADSFLIDNSGLELLGPPGLRFSQFDDTGIFDELKSKKLPMGTAEFLDSQNKTYLVSYSKVGIGDLFVISLVQKELALRAVQRLYTKSILFFIFLVSLATLIAVFAASRLTAKLRELHEITKKVGEGDFNVEIKVDSNDEVGSLAQGFNTMADEVKRLLSETAEKARMEGELETAKTVQETLFPASIGEIGPIKIVGYYEPASECGGDWWHYCQIDKKVFVWIGDATGHGAPAALITSAAKSAATVIERLNGVSPGIALSLLNQAIHETSKGKMLMTFFLGSIDLETGEFVYSNASHDPPFLMKKKEEALKKKDLIPLNDVNNPRLGEKTGIEFKETSLQLSPGDTILFYTDGINDIKNPSGEIWGERNFIRHTLKAVSENPGLEEVVDSLKTDFSEFRNEALLDDDITFFVCRFGSVA